MFIPLSSASIRGVEFIPDLFISRALDLLGISADANAGEAAPEIAEIRNGFTALLQDLSTDRFYATPNYIFAYSRSEDAVYLTQKVTAVRIRADLGRDVLDPALVSRIGAILESIRDWPEADIDEIRELLNRITAFVYDLHFNPQYAGLPHLFMIDHSARYTAYLNYDRATPANSTLGFYPSSAGSMASPDFVGSVFESESVRGL